MTTSQEKGVQVTPLPRKPKNRPKKPKVKVETVEEEVEEEEPEKTGLIEIDEEEIPEAAVAVLQELQEQVLMLREENRALQEEPVKWTFKGWVNDFFRSCWEIAMRPVPGLVAALLVVATVPVTVGCWPSAQSSEITSASVTPGEGTDELRIRDVNGKVTTLTYDNENLKIQVVSDEQARQMALQLETAKREAMAEMMQAAAALEKQRAEQLEHDWESKLEAINQGFDEKVERTKLRIMAEVLNKGGQDQTASTGEQTVGALKN